jgi:CheY-like chemotaxis protein
MSRKKILVVDDDEVVLKSLTIKLNAKGYDVLTAKDGSEAIIAVRKQKPDLILLDISFPPDMENVLADGFSIMEWFKRLGEAASTPVIFITGGDPAVYQDKVKASGAVAFFHKPIDHDDLFGVIRQTLKEDPAPV